jgi:hypothetical protein
MEIPMKDKEVLRAFHRDSNGCFLLPSTDDVRMNLYVTNERGMKARRLMKIGLSRDQKVCMYAIYSVFIIVFNFPSFSQTGKYRN